MPCLLFFWKIMPCLISREHFYRKRIPVYEPQPFKITNSTVSIWPHSQAPCASFFNSERRPKPGFDWKQRENNMRRLYHLNDSTKIDFPDFFFSRRAMRHVFRLSWLHFIGKPYEVMIVRSCSSALIAAIPLLEFYAPVSLLIGWIPEFENPRQHTFLRLSAVLLLACVPESECAIPLYALVSHLLSKCV